MKEIKKILNKRILKSIGYGLVASLGLGPLGTRAEPEVSASINIHAKADFYAPLAPHGAWITVSGYGRCWHPAGVGVEWRPYCEGHWLWTDCGWYWASDEPWAWACYHYGYWVDDPVYAWIWVPGIDWGPAWVSWRVGAGYIGWAPLPPPGWWFAHVAAPSSFVFVQTARFLAPVRPRAVIANDQAILHATTALNNIKRETRDFGGAHPQRVVINEGPGLAEVQRSTGKRVKVVPIQTAQGHGSPTVPRGPAVGAAEFKDKSLLTQTERFQGVPERQTRLRDNKGLPDKPRADGLDGHRAGEAVVPPAPSNRLAQPFGAPRTGKSAGRQRGKP